MKARLGSRGCGARASVVASAAMIAACTPSRAVLFDPVEREVKRRSGLEVTWRDQVLPGADAQRHIDALLARPLDADSAARVALLASPALQSAFAELGLGGAALARRGALPNPEIEAEVLSPIDSDEEAHIELSIMQDLVGIVTGSLRRRAASAELEATRRRAIAAAIATASRARAAYYHAAADTEVASAAGRAAQAARTSADLAERLHAAGNLADLRLAQEQALREQAEIDLETAVERAAASRHALALALGLPGDATAWTTAPLRALPERAPATDELEQQAIGANLELEALRWIIVAAGRTIGVGRAGWIPHLGVGVASQREHGGWEVGPALSLSLPLFDNGQGERAAGWAQLRGAQAALADATLVVRAAARTLQSRVASTHARAARLERTLLPLRHRIVEQSVLQYNAMQVGPFELLLARQQEIDAERRAVEARRDFWLAAGEADALRAGSLVLSSIPPSSPSPPAGASPAADH